MLCSIGYPHQHWIVAYVHMCFLLHIYGRIGKKSREEKDSKRGRPRLGSVHVCVPRYNMIICTQLAMLNCPGVT